MKSKSPPKGCIYEMELIYNPKLGVYTTLMLCMNKLYDILLGEDKIQKIQK